MKGEYLVHQYHTNRRFRARASSLPKYHFPPHLPRHIPPLNLTVSSIASPPDLLAHFPRSDNVVHTLARLQVSEHRSRNITVNVLHSLTGGGEQGPDKGSHGPAENDDPETGLQGLLGGRLHLGRSTRVGKNGAVEEDEARLPVRLGIVEDGLQPRIFGWVLGGDD